MPIRTLVLFLIALPAVASCSMAGGDFPSLERRPYENNSPIVAPEAPPPPVALSADLVVKVDALNARHRAAQAAFDNDIRSVQTLASRAAGTAAGSETWVNAHLQLSRLDKARADSVAVVREFDTLISDSAGADSNLVPLLAGAQKPVADAVAAQNAEIERLSRLIGE